MQSGLGQKRKVGDTLNGSLHTAVKKGGMLADVLGDLSDDDDDEEEEDQEDS